MWGGEKKRAQTSTGEKCELWQKGKTKHDDEPTGNAWKWEDTIELTKENNIHQA